MVTIKNTIIGMCTALSLWGCQQGYPDTPQGAAAAAGQPIETAFISSVKLCLNALETGQMSADKLEQAKFIESPYSGQFGKNLYYTALSTKNDNIHTLGGDYPYTISLNTNYEKCGAQSWIMRSPEYYGNLLMRGVEEAGYKVVGIKGGFITFKNYTISNGTHTFVMYGFVDNSVSEFEIRKK